MAGPLLKVHPVTADQVVKLRHSERLILVHVCVLLVFSNICGAQSIHVIRI